MLSVNRDSTMCTHDHTIIDERSGSIICTDCALVTEYFIGASSTTYTYDNTQHNNTIIDVIDTNSASEREYILDICENAHIPIYVCDLTLKLFNTFILRKKNIPFSRRNILIFSLYEVLGEEKIVYPPQFLSKYTGITVNILCKMEASLSTGIKDQSAYLMMSRFCALLNIPREHRMTIEKITMNFPKIISLFSIQPHCQCAVIIFLYCKELNLKYSMADISTACWVTPPTIRRIIHQLDSKYVKQITLLCTFPFFYNTCV